MKEVVIVSGVRTAIGAYCGMFREIPVEKLAAITLNEAVKKAKIKPEQVDKLRADYGIYIVRSGRINVAGMTEANMDRLCDAIKAVL